MKRFLLRLTCALALFSSASSLFADTPTKKFKIGAILPLTGDVAQLGAYARNGLTLAMRDLSPSDRERISLVIEDDAMDPKRSLSAAQKLIEMDHIDALIAWSSSTAATVLGLTEGHHIPMLSIASDPRVAVGTKYAFTYWALPQDEARTLYQLLKKLGKKSLGLLTLTNSGALAVRDALRDIVQQDHALQIAFDEEVPSDLKDFRALFTKLRMGKPIDAFIPILFPGQLAPAAVQARGVGLKAPIYGFETFDDPREIAAAHGAFSGAIFATAADPTDEFIAAYRHDYPDTSWYSANNVYDCFTLLAVASRNRAKSEQIVRFLETLKDFPTSSGIVSASGDHRFKLPTILKEVGMDGVVRNYSGGHDR